MKEDQKYIYYACGETVDKIKMLPVMETLSDKGYEVLCMDDSIDEFCTKMIAKYDDKEFKSIAGRRPWSGKRRGKGRDQEAV